MPTHAHKLDTKVKENVVCFYFLNLNGLMGRFSIVFQYFFWIFEDILGEANLHIIVVFKDKPFQSLISVQTQTSLNANLKVNKISSVILLWLFRR